MISALLLAAVLGTTYDAEFISCYDGDTCRFKIHLGIDGIVIEDRAVRLCDIDTPEIAQDPRLGKFARDYVIATLKKAKRIELRVPTENQHGGFNRLLAWVYVNGRNLNERLVKEGIAKRYRIECK